MSKYTCNICGFEFDEAMGDPARGIAPGTRWANIPEGWICPICGADKTMFQKACSEAVGILGAPWWAPTSSSITASAFGR